MGETGQLAAWVIEVIWDCLLIFGLPILFNWRLCNFKKFGDYCDLIASFLPQ